jgi:putative ABC transport system substrate-binding protein
MRRREFFGLLSGAAAAWPLAARAQQKAMPVIGLLTGVSATAAPLLGFRQGLKESGFVEGQNVAIEYRFAEGQYERMPELAADLVAKRVSVIATIGENAAKAAQAASAGAIPIVFALGDDPVTLGLVASFNRPGGNITGVTSIGHTLGPKRVEWLRELLPQATTIALLTNPKQPRDFERRDVEEKTRAVGWQLKYLTASSVDEFDAVFAELTRERIGSLIIGNETFFFSEIRRLASLAAAHAIPAIGPLRAFADAGGLMSYGANIPDIARYAGIYTGRVVKGDKPADLPVMQPTKFELVINLKAAKALGLTIPLTLQVAATDVIE